MIRRMLVGPPPKPWRRSHLHPARQVLYACRRHPDWFHIFLGAQSTSKSAFGYQLRRSGMFYSTSHPEPATSEMIAQECPETAEQVAELLTGGGPLPAPAGRFGITDPQKWIDLCA